VLEVLNYGHLAQSALDRQQHISLLQQLLAALGKGSLRQPNPLGSLTELSRVVDVTWGDFPYLDAVVLLAAKGRHRPLDLGEEPADFINRLQQLPIQEASRWVGTIHGLAELLDQQWDGPAEPQFLSEHDDELRSIERGYGEATRPEDYLDGFSAFVRDPGNDLPALTTVLQRPWDLTRKDLRELRLALDQRGYNEATLATAWRETTNQQMAASIMGYIRQAALGDPLVPYEQRVEKALQRILASRSWTTPQRQWLQRIANQTKAITIVDREALDDDALIFRREGGGWQRLDRMFAGELDGVLREFKREVWAA